MRSLRFRKERIQGRNYLGNSTNCIPVHVRSPEINYEFDYCEICNVRFGS